MPFSLTDMPRMTNSHLAVCNFCNHSGVHEPTPQRSTSSSSSYTEFVDLNEAEPWQKLFVMLLSQIPL